MAHTTKHNLSRFGLILVTTCCSLLIAACAGSGPAKPGAVVCNGGTCSVDVTVQNCVLSPIPTIDADKTIHHIKWTIQTADYHFPQDGIVTEGPNGSGITPDPGVTGAKGTMFTMADDHKVTGQIKYTVRVVRDSDGTACAPYDPYINNR